MKIFKLALLFGWLILFISGCDDDDGYSLGDYWITIGTIEGDRDNFIIVTDDGDRLYPSVNGAPWYEFEDGERLWVNYTILGDGDEGSNIDYYVKVNNFEDILTKDIFILTPENADSIGHDPVWVTNPEENIWIANDYLNIFFKYRGAPWWLHFINVVSDINNPTTPDGTPILELRHNAKGDPYDSPPLIGFISINLKSLQEEGKDSVKFILRAIDDNGEYALDEELTYVYEPVQDTLPIESVLLKTLPDKISVE